MRDLSTLTFHPTAEKIVDLLCEKTQNTNPQFFRIMVCYYICKMAASMRAQIITKDRGVLPVNFYGVNLGISGSGKGFSTNILEDHIINRFHARFFSETLPVIADENLNELAAKRSMVSATLGIDEAYALCSQEYASLGEMAFSFDSATTAAVKQMRHKLLMADIGAVNLEIDEIGSNLLGNTEVLTTFLELYDVGKVKQKLTKNTKDNVRSKEIQGKTPTNLILFGTPTKLFDGAKTEEEYWSFISTGYGRRSFFGYSQSSTRDKSLTVDEIYDRLTSPVSEKFMEDISKDFGELAMKTNHNFKIDVSKEVSKIVIKYKMLCEDKADQMGDLEDSAKAEMSHRFFKALKLAGGYAFIDRQSSISIDNIYHAICMAEESGRAFERMQKQDKSYVKLAKHIATVGREVTHVDLAEKLPFYKGTSPQKADMMNMAITWGYQNSIIIKQKIENNIEFITGEALKKTNLDEIYLSHSNDLAAGYKNIRAPFDKLIDLVKMDSHHWCNHHTESGRRSEENMMPGCNTVVIDVDGGVTIKEAAFLLADYKFLLHTTKSHTAANNRFRIIFPLNYNVKLSEEDFKEFMINIYEWLPFDCDTATGQRSRKWLTNSHGVAEYSKGTELLDALLFIPRTTKNADRKTVINNLKDLNNIERWFISSMKTGSRNNQLIRYALMLVDSGFNYAEINQKVADINARTDKPLSDIEIRNTVMKSVEKALFKRGGQ
jgi:hypothetical protein